MKFATVSPKRYCKISKNYGLLNTEGNWSIYWSKSNNAQTSIDLLKLW